jgi:hypothetical protein
MIREAGADISARRPVGSTNCRSLLGPLTCRRRAERELDYTAERFIVNETLFTSLRQTRAVLAAWQRDYNEVRPHSAHAGQTPASIRLLPRSPASSPLRAGFADGLRPDLSQAARGSDDRGGRGRETPLDRTEKHRPLLLSGGKLGLGGAQASLRSFLWFAVIVAGLTVRTELTGVTSIIRALDLQPGLHNKLRDHFHSSALKLDRLSALWAQAVLRLFPAQLRVNGRLVLVGDGIKIGKRGKKMPAVKLLHQQSDVHTKPEYIMGHSLQAVSLLVKAAQSVFMLHGSGTQVS